MYYGTDLGEYVSLCVIVCHCVRQRRPEALYRSWPCLPMYVAPLALPCQSAPGAPLTLHTTRLTPHPSHESHYCWPASLVGGVCVVLAANASVIDLHIYTHKHTCHCECN